VLYIAKKPGLENLLNSTATEDGRIGYAAIARARNLLILAIPSYTSDFHVKNLESKSFMAWT